MFFRKNFRKEFPYKIIVPRKKMFISINDDPWGYELDSEIEKCLIEQFGAFKENWTYRLYADSINDPSNSQFRFKSKDDALRFKLIWG
jgi:hypothetical protein